MKRLFFIMMAILFIITMNAQSRDFGVGIIVGEPTGVCIKNWLDTNKAIDAAMAWSFSGINDSLHFHFDYLYHSFGLLEDSQGSLPLYFGIGSRIRFRSRWSKTDEDTRVAVRVPFGFNYIFDDVPLDFFLEIVPLLDLVPETDFGLNAAVGVRYFLD